MKKTLLVILAGLGIASSALADAYTIKGKRKCLPNNEIDCKGRKGNCLTIVVKGTISCDGYQTPGDHPQLVPDECQTTYQVTLWADNEENLREETIFCDLLSIKSSEDNSVITLGEIKCKK